MAKKKKSDVEKVREKSTELAHIRVSEVSDVLEENYMPYAMSVIVSRALPEIDGLKPAHRKLMYTMYKMGLLKGGKTKCANIVGTTMRLNPHGDSSIYETMVRLSRGNESLLIPYVDSKGNFGKVYSRDMAYAASRYTEAKLDSVAEEFFKDIDKNVVDFVDNYDSTTTEPSLLPVTFPTILTNPNMGIAVGMSSTICAFNLEEICNATIEILNETAVKGSPEVTTERLLEIVKAPDFSTGGLIVYNKDVMKKIYEEGRGTIYLRAKYHYNAKDNCIEITEIPYTTTIEAIIEGITTQVKNNTIKDLTDIRDETDKDGLKIVLDLKRNTDVEQLMARLFLTTTLQSSLSCNFNIILKGQPRTLGIKAILENWIEFRVECIKRQIAFDVVKNKKKLHILEGLAKVLLDLDQAIKIVRNTNKDKDVLKNLMDHFKIDEEQATYVADIKLRNFNKEYILNKTKDISATEKEIKRLEGILDNDKKVKLIIIKELEEISKKYNIPRKTQIVSEKKVRIDAPEEVLVDDYNTKLFVTNEGYLKKVPLTSLRGSGEHRLKEGDFITQEIESTNKSDILIFTNKQLVYKLRAFEVEDTKLSSMGEYMPNLIGLAEGETIEYVVSTVDYSGSILLFFENGKCARVNMKGYETKQNRKQLVNAYSKASKLLRMYYTADDEDIDVALISSIDKVLVTNTKRISVNNTKTSQGVGIMKGAKSDKDFRVVKVSNIDELNLTDVKYYRTTGNTAAVGKFLKKEDSLSK